MQRFILPAALVVMLSASALSTPQQPPKKPAKPDTTQVDTTRNHARTTPTKPVRPTDPDTTRTRPKQR